MDPDVALVIPEINPQAALNAKGIIASPNCSTTQLVLALKPLHDAARVRRVIVSTYQAVSGAGRGGTADLLEGTKAHLAGQRQTPTTFAHPIAFNAIPQIGSFKEEGYTSEELKMARETRKILGDDSLRISASCVRVPVADCHSECIWVETERPVSPDEARRLFTAFPGPDGDRRPRRRPLPDALRLRRQRRRVHRPHPPRPLLRERPDLLVRERQPPQGGGDERSADRGVAGRDTALIRLRATHLLLTTAANPAA